MHLADLVPLLLGTICSATWWFVRDVRRRTRAVMTMGLCLVLYALPWFTGGHIVCRGLTALVCCAVFAPKLLDAATAPTVWKTRTLGDWASYLINPFVLCFRRHLLDRPRPASANRALCLRGAAQIGVGGAVLYWAFTTDWDNGLFWLEHGTKLVGVYLALFDGGFVAINGLLGVCGGAYMVFCRHPVLARTPADFWRRYNRDAGRFLTEHVYARLGWLPVSARIGMVFMANGLLHEYLVLAICGRVVGVVLAFFAIQALAVALTWRMRPTGFAAVIATLVTISFNVATSVLFFLGVNSILPWYANIGTLGR